MKEPNRNYTIYLATIDSKPVAVTCILDGETQGFTLLRIKFPNQLLVFDVIEVVSNVSRQSRTNHWRMHYGVMRQPKAPRIKAPRIKRNKPDPIEFAKQFLAELDAATTINQIREIEKRWYK